MDVSSRTGNLVPLEADIPPLILNFSDSELQSIEISGSHGLAGFFPSFVDDLSTALPFPFLEINSGEEGKTFD